MSYHMNLYPDEAAEYPVPQAGDVFIVTRVDQIADAHYGSFAHIRLQPLATDEGEPCAVTIKKVSKRNLT